jgi:uncharacterized membrane protein YcaP (DUF421 family)
METVFRVFIIYLVIVLGLRIMGKREFAQLSPLELVLVLLIPELVSQALVREDFSLTNGLIALTTLFSLVFLNSLATYHSKKAAFVVQGEPSILVDHGQMINSTMNKQRIGAEEIFAEMHKSGLQALSEVKWAILETDGRITFIPAEDRLPQPLIRNEEPMPS